jgi:hypothetical protein
MLTVLLKSWVLVDLGVLALAVQYAYVRRQHGQ